MKLTTALVCFSFVFGSMALAKNDGSDIPACKGVTDVCMAANVSATDSKIRKSDAWLSTRRT
jgi:hypothetical protein